MISGEATRPRDAMIAPVSRTNQMVTVAGEYELRVEVLHAGTRSEGRIGRLFRSGREVGGTHVGEAVTVESEGVTFVFRGDERPHLWSVSGWVLEPSGE